MLDTDIFTDIDIDTFLQVPIAIFLMPIRARGARRARRREVIKAIETYLGVDCDFALLGTCGLDARSQ